MNISKLDTLDKNLLRGATMSNNTYTLKRRYIIGIVTTVLILISCYSISGEKHYDLTVKKALASSYTLLIDKSDYTIYLLSGEETTQSWPIAIGKNPGQKQRVGDMTTPTGVFYVDEIIDSSSWTHDFKDGKGEIAGAYGPWFISLVTGWDGIGIHGTHDPNSIGTMVSEGCIRLYNEDLAELKNIVTVGMKVTIQE